jgi:succinyl-CoA synthetase beta subunit
MLSGTFLATSLGFTPGSAQHTECKEVVTKLYKVFTEKECTLLEVNPLVETKEGKVRDSTLSSVLSCIVFCYLLLLFSADIIIL